MQEKNKIKKHGKSTDRCVNLEIPKEKKENKKQVFVCVRAWH
jgi:hypothetical protein